MNTSSNCETLTTAGVLALNQWHYVVATYDGSYKRIYINGALSTSAAKTGQIIQNDYPVAIGGCVDASGNCNGWFDNSTIDEVKIYNRTLSTDQIYKNYLMGLNKYNTSVIDSDETNEGEIWKCQITPNDAM